MMVKARRAGASGAISLCITKLECAAVHSFILFRFFSSTYASKTAKINRALSPAWRLRVPGVVGAVAPARLGAAGAPPSALALKGTLSFHAASRHAI
jgi:hypothetical protein